jgi:negative regulator of sigma E activity
VLGVTTTLVSLLENHYVVAYAGATSADNRPVQVVEAQRADGTLAALFYLDQATKLPLARKVYDTSSQPIDQSWFVNVQIGTPASDQLAQGTADSTKAQPVPQSTTSPWTFPIPLAKLMVFARSGWRVPAALPDGLTLFTGAMTGTTAGPVLDVGYSDGLYVVSLFEQRGKLATKLAGWQKTTVGGRAVYASGSAERSLTWSGNGMVYTLIAFAPSQTVTAIVDALPYDRPPGFWKRMSRGIARLASLVNPFH